MCVVPRARETAAGIYSSVQVSLPFICAGQNHLFQKPFIPDRTSLNYPSISWCLRWHGHLLISLGH